MPKPTKRDLIDQTFEAIEEFHAVYAELEEKVHRDELPGIVMGCDINYYVTEFYKIIKRVERTEKFYFRYYLSSIREINEKMKEYRDTGKWMGITPRKDGE